MKFKIKKKILLQNLNAVSRAISSKNLIPILSGIKFELTNKGLILTASDNDIFIEGSILKKEIDDIEKEGKTVVQGKYLLEIIRKLEDEYISFELLDDVKLNILNGKTKYSLNCMEYSDFPNLKVKENKKPIIIIKKEFKNLIYKTAFAVSLQETRPILTGINLKIEGNKIEGISTDSYRLAKKEILLEEKTNEKVNVIIPGRNLFEFLKIIESEESEKENNIEMHIESNHVLFKYKNIYFQTRILSGTFPDISKLIPKEAQIKIEVNTNEMFNVIDRASLLTSEREKNIINFKNINDIVTISSNSPEIGKVEEQITIQKDKKDKNIEISFSSKFMLDALKAIESKETIIEFINEIQPIIIKDKNDKNYIQLILPIKTY